MRNTVFMVYLFFLSVKGSIAQTHVAPSSILLEKVWARVADSYGKQSLGISVAFSPDGKFIASGSQIDKTLILWRTSDGSEIWRQNTPFAIKNVTWSSDSLYLMACGDDFKIHIWAVETGKLAREIPQFNTITATAWSQKGNLLATNALDTTATESFLNQKQSIFRLYQMPEGKLLFQEKQKEIATHIQFSKDGQTLASVNKDKIIIRKVKNPSLVRTLEGKAKTYFTSADFTPEGRYLAAADSTGNISVWDWQMGTLTRKIQVSNDKIEVVKWHPSGDYLMALGEEPHISIFKLSEILLNYGEVTAFSSVFAHDWGTSFDFHPEGSLVVSAHKDGIMRLWVWLGVDIEMHKRRRAWLNEMQRIAKERD